jgi:hypothetical protein
MLEQPPVPELILQPTEVGMEIQKQGTDKIQTKDQV